MSNIAYTPKNAPETVVKQGRLLICRNGECKLNPTFGLYFDGTNNNMYLDDTAEGAYSHSNVARLYKAAYDETVNGLVRIYIPGVGTPFKEIGEPTPHPRGSSMGEKGAERIRFAVLSIVNRLSQILKAGEIVKPSAIAEAVADERNYRFWKSRLTSLITQSNRRPNGPKIDHIVLDVFGFSRGAAEARSFVNQLLKNFCDASGHTFCGIGLRIRFMGLFDTVASVGFADSVPGPFEGHQDWADQDLLVIPPQVEQCVHLVAGHEARKSFPVDLVLGKDGRYPTNCIEVVYPGMHSDVGGGYGAGDQGKAIGGQGEVLSQIALNHMYERALKAGVPLRGRAKLADARLEYDFAIRENLKAHYENYVHAAALEGKSLPAIGHIERHHRGYLLWRSRVLEERVFNRLQCMANISTQDRVNLSEANTQFGHYIAKLEGDEKTDAANQSLRRADPRIPTQPVDTAGLHFYRKYWKRLGSFYGNQTTMDFFDRYVHDSRAGFTIVDPVSANDHRIIHERLKRRDEEHKRARAEYERKERQYQLHGEDSGYTATTLPYPPEDPLSENERANLGEYEAGRKPIYSDHNPAAGNSGGADGRAIPGMGRWDRVYSGAVDRLAMQLPRREMDWSYLHPRQLFAYARVRYEDRA
ncbi:T6SS phospholipase effector Tle1-like catalytic domain-containing protein [Lysobacter soli]|uniref:T6SS phospholipase effector Tle1-like catalytic domain-containing protein n=1 Tax=Lysobacter soli TaxID=453783 RepID=UPI003694668D